MNTENVWEVLSQLPIGTIVALIIVFATIVGVVCGGVMKLFQLFTKVKDKKDEYEDLRETIHKHDDQIDDIQKKIDDIIHILEKQNGPRWVLYCISYGICPEN